MDVVPIIFDFAIPILLITFGAYFTKNPVKKGAVLLGHRTRRSKQSEEAWDYANKRRASLWKKWGMILFGIVALSYFINPLTGRDLNMFHFILGVVFVFIPTFIIEGELKRKFGEPDADKEPVQGLRDNKKMQKQQQESKKTQKHQPGSGKMQQTGKKKQGSNKQSSKGKSSNKQNSKEKSSSNQKT